ncbi:unnamed protein product [Acanthoscelides obtectus]|uniref:Uncharacterized protein n=1 Tax=Acanthoscelides obtectus TaxID=200917 RepID=A0A9P0LX20_ACAOB|nr:unnamed protein product [Acanthoscelides obtectus]CAK1641598.1 hypothetical protein AOBTE_LOCUS12499 [Acanthoscelides obtectus]
MRTYYWLITSTSSKRYLVKVTNVVSQDLSNLRINIENAVRQGLAPLKNLGPIISHSVYGAYRPVQQSKMPGISCVRFEYLSTLG